MSKIDEIKTLMKGGDIAGAEALCKAELQKTPDDAQLKMLFGTCRQLQGDEETFRRIHDELAPEMEKNSSAETISLWRKYHKLWMTLIVGALVLGASSAGVIRLGKSIQDQFKAMIHAAYAGPLVHDMEVRPEINNDLYAGPKYEDREMLPE